jgi:hypothetical protein
MQVCAFATQLPAQPQTALDVHTIPAPLQLPPAPPQQGWPLPPQAQVPDAQVRFAPQAPCPVPEQHCWPWPPHAAHVPPLPQIAPAPQFEPLQHC